MNLLFLAERYPPDLGGVATSAGRISRAIRDLGAAVDVITWTRSLEAGVVVQEEGNPAVFRMGRFRKWEPTMPHALNLFDWLLSSRSYDAVWGHYLAPAGFAGFDFIVTRDPKGFRESPIRPLTPEAFLPLLESE